jgi:two-component system sensor histidine kinase KdpD
VPANVPLSPFWIKVGMSDNSRPDPDALLARVQREEASRQRGRLKIFFGASPGVGKTFSMLAAAQALKSQGIDVVAGYIEPHARPETSRLQDGLEQLPVRNETHRDRIFSEFDLNAALQQRATLTLVDELAHTNIAGSRHAKRWQDVAELLDAGLDVWSTLNVQHLESLNDVIAQITGVRVRETLPDHVFEAADEVELIDLPPDEIITRLQQGRVYRAEQAERATQHFFRKGNLIALRELALRAMADRVDAQVRDYRDDHTIDRVWQVRERLLVCLGPGDNGESLVRAGRRMAARLRAPWSVVYVETPRLQKLPEARRERMLQWLRLAESLGAETATLFGPDIADAIMEYARTNNVTRMVMGKPRPRRFSPFRASPLQKITELAEDMDVVVVARDHTRDHANAPDSARQSPSRGLDFSPPRAPDKRRYLLAAAMTALITILALPLGRLSPTNIVMLYLVGTVLVSLRLGSGPSALNAVLSVLAFDFFFVPPHLTFAVSDSEYFITFAVMLAVGLLLSRLTGAVRAQARVAAARERRMRELYAMSRELAIGMETQYIAEVAVRHLATVFDAQLVLLLPDLNDKIHYPSSQLPLPESLKKADLGVAQWVYDNEKSAGFGTQTLPGTEAHYLPLKASMRTRGVLAIKAGDVRRILAPEQYRLLETFATQIAITLERVHFAEVAQSTEVSMQSERLRNHLLSAISHDLRTPLAGIVGTTSALLTQTQMDAATKQELLEGLHEEALHMTSLVHNLLDMARIEAGAITLRPEWQPLEEVVGSTLNIMGKRLEQHPVTLALAPDLPWIKMDSVLMERVLVNLLDNAVKYTPPGSAITIAAQAVEPVLEIRVRDHGPGLPAGRDVFQKFVRGEEESGTPGVGLGLALCRAIMRAMGGHISAHDHEGGGAEFLLSLPLGEAPPSLPDESTMLEPQTS